MSDTKNESKATPGPWVAEFQPEGELVAHWDIKAGATILACLPHDTQEPDARLIAAAPDLLAALIASREAIDILMARIINAAAIDADPATYHPSKSGKPWTALLQAKAALEKAGAS